MKLRQVFRGYKRNDDVTGAIALYNLQTGPLEKRKIIRPSTKTIRRNGEDTPTTVEIWKLVRAL